MYGFGTGPHLQVSWVMAFCELTTALQPKHTKAIRDTRSFPLPFAQRIRRNPRRTPRGGIRRDSLPVCTGRVAVCPVCLV